MAHPKIEVEFPDPTMFKLVNIEGEPIGNDWMEWATPHDTHFVLWATNIILCNKIAYPITYSEPARASIDRLAASGSVAFAGEFATEVWNRVTRHKMLHTKRQATEYRHLWKTSLQHDIRHYHYPKCTDIIREFIRRAERAKRNLTIDTFANETPYTKPSNIVKAWEDANNALLTLTKAPCVGKWEDLLNNDDCYRDRPPRLC